MLNVGTEDNVKITCTSNILWCIEFTIGCLSCFLIECKVEEVLQHIETILAVSGVVIDINLCRAVHISTVYIEVIILIAFHHLTQIVIVGHLHWHTIRIGLTQISL